ncbi:MAG: hypothetical protein OEX00_06620 [Gammaproteobacteria bacterium]|nr:hypothetical protein [Gammaproteobacteria bacterium]MDH5692992.1 hypothetical protein [Gammaproteobacteria bacterium]
MPLSRHVRRNAFQLLRPTLAKPASNASVESHAMRYRELIQNIEKQGIEISDAQAALKELLGEKILLHPINSEYYEAEIENGGLLRLAVGNDGSGGWI